MDKNSKPIKIGAAVPSEKPVDAVMSNVSAEVVVVDQCPQDGKIYVDLTLPDLDDVYGKEDTNKNIIVLIPEFERVVFYSVLGRVFTAGRFERVGFCFAMERVFTSGRH